jgi:hypothetical protein
MKTTVFAQVFQFFNVFKHCDITIAKLQGSQNHDKAGKLVKTKLCSLMSKQKTWKNHEIAAVIIDVRTE